MYQVFGKRKDPEILVPLIIYFHLRKEDISVNVLDLIENSRLSEKMFFCLVFQILEFISKRVTTLPGDSKALEGEYERRKFRDFKNFLEFYFNCPLCGMTHDKSYIISLYFNLRKAFKRKLKIMMKKTRHDYKCAFNNKKCLFFRRYKCNIGIPCKKCIRAFQKNEKPMRK